ncbi:MAG: MFS transporter [Gemmataceae bacterium]
MTTHHSALGTQHSSPWRWWVCGILMFATLLNYMDRQVLPQIGTELKDTYQLDDARYGIVSRNFAWAFATGAICFGLIADRVGPRLLYPLVLIGWSVAGLATPLMARPEYSSLVEDPAQPGSGPYYWLLYCRTLLGFFEAGHWPCALLTARQVLTAKDRPLGNGLLQSGASLGAVLVPPYIALVRHLGGGWEIAFWTIGGIGLLWVPVWLLLIRRGDLDHPAEAPIAKVPDAPSQPYGIGRFFRVYLTLFTIILGINVSWQFIREWLPKYMKESQGFSADVTDFIVPAYYISAELGCFGFGLFVRYLVGRGREVHSARVMGYAVFATITACWRQRHRSPAAGLGVGAIAPRERAFSTAPESTCARGELAGERMLFFADSSPRQPRGSRRGSCTN